MSHFEMGDNGVVIPFDAMVMDSDWGEIKGYPLLLNIHTMARNIVESYKRGEGSEHDFLNNYQVMVDSTLKKLPGFFAQHGLVLFLYEPDYSAVKYGGGRKKLEPTTELQAMLAKWNKLVLEEIQQHGQGILKLDGDFSAGTVDKHAATIGAVMYPNQQGKSYQGPYCVTTHYAQDLHRPAGFDELLLVESYTGDVRRRPLFNRKLKLNSDQKKYIPLCPFTQQVFGDNTLYAPQDLDLRRAVEKIARKHQWTSATPKARVAFAVQQDDPMLAKLYSQALG